MIVLANTTDSLEVVLGGLKSANDCPVLCAYADYVAATSFTPGRTPTTTNGTSAVTVAPAPAASTFRQVKLLTLVNADTVTTVATVRYNNGVSTFNLIVATLAVGDVLQYADGEGFRVFDKTGAMKETATAGAAGAAGAPGAILYMEGDAGEEGMMIPGQQGPAGNPGAAGTAGAPGAILFLEGDRGDDGMPMPGVPGPAGATGATGSAGSPGATGATGAQGPVGVTLFLDGEQGEMGMPIPGPAGAAGAGGGGGDALANFVNAANALTNPSAATLSANTWNVITASSACNAKLPTPTAGHVVGVRLVNSSTNLFTLNPNSTEKIQPGANSSRIMWAGESAVLVSDGTDWIKVAGLTLPMQAEMYKAADSSTPTSTVDTKIATDSSGIDNTGLMCDTVTNKRINIQRSGTYSIDFQAWVDPGSGTISRVLGELYLNGSRDTFFDAPKVTTSEGYAGYAVGRDSNYIRAGLSAGDHLELYGAITYSAGSPVFKGGSTFSRFYVTEQPNW